MILTVMKAIYAIGYIEGWKYEDFNVDWSCDCVIPVGRCNQLSYKATDIGSLSYVGSNEPVRNECCSYMWNISYIELRMWNQVSYDPRSYQSNLCNCVSRNRKKSQDFNRVWTREHAILVWRSNQLSYEATYCESWSFVGPKEPVRNKYEVIYEISYILYCGCLIK